MIIRTAIDKANIKLKDKKIESFLLDSEILMSKALNKKRLYNFKLEKNLEPKNFIIFNI